MKQKNNIPIFNILDLCSGFINPNNPKNKVATIIKNNWTPVPNIEHNKRTLTAGGLNTSPDIWVQSYSSNSSRFDTLSLYVRISLFKFLQRIVIIIILIATIITSDTITPAQWIPVLAVL